MWPFIPAIDKYGNCRSWKKDTDTIIVRILLNHLHGYIIILKL